MTIEKGKAWGQARPLPVDGVVVHSDAEARAAITTARRRGDVLPTLGLLGGDLCRTLGGTGDEARLRSSAAMTFPCDLGIVEIGGEELVFVAHLIARRTWWFGRQVAVMNAQWLGRWDLGPRSHPNDGLLDLTDGTLPLGQRLEARRRLHTGTHVPHPALDTRRAPTFTLDLDPALGVWLDGQRVARAGHLEVRCEPDALHVVV
ncbi:MAG TPA: hypothetical protein VIJ47_04085 [Acidimicrobiales bacterium]